MTKREAQKTALLVIAHGSRHQPANEDLRSLANRLACLADYPIVEPAFLELAEPDIAEGGERCIHQGATRVLMVPYFLSAGVHLLRDLTAARDALHARYPEVEIQLGAPLGPHPLLDQLVIERASQLDREGENQALPTAELMAATYQSMGPSDSD